MIAELNKIAIIHLFLLGFEDELSNFTLGLTNPSKQADLLGLEVWKEKVATYKECVTALQDGTAPTSHTWAKKHVFGWSDEEIKNDLYQQRVERAVGAELNNTATIITKTGLFDNIDKLYTQKTGTTSNADAAGGTPPPSGGGEMGGMPPAPGGLPENAKKDNLKILLENENFFDDESFIDLSKARNSLGQIEDQLKKLMGD
jgi:hypothetical protein